MTENRPVCSQIVIVGGGMVGAALACGLAQRGFTVTVVEAGAPPVFDPASSPDLRISAISAGSVALLQRLEVWESVLAMRAFPYRRLETWEWEQAVVAFDAAMVGLPALGYMVENNVLQFALWQRLQQLKISVISSAVVTELTPDDDGWGLTLDDGRRLHAGLVIGADGASSRVRQLAGIDVNSHEYAQHCMLISVQCAQPPGETTWQQFTPAGPRALLPLFDNWASLVWYDSPDRIYQLQQMTMERLEEEIIRHFPKRAGRVVPLAAGAFPLIRRHARRYVLPGLALAGDAAHTIHPLAGQGVNLGYRDVDALIDVLTRARDCQRVWTDEETLLRYQRKRRFDNQLMQSGMDLFHVAFGNSLTLPGVLRNLAMKAAGCSGPLKRQLLRYSLGLW